MTELRISREISTSVAADLRLRAAEIVQAVIPLDVPRLVVVKDDAADRQGSSIGSGHRLATAHGHQGAVAVRVDAEQLLVPWLAKVEGDPDGVELAARAALADVVLVTCHEVSHALDYPADDPADVETALAWIDACRNQDDATEIAGSHRARWAVMYSIIAGRCLRHVRRAARGYMGQRVAVSICNYGHDARALRRAAGRVPRGVSLQEYFASGSPACRRLAAVTMTDAERAVVIGRWLTPRAAG